MCCLALVPLGRLKRKCPYRRASAQSCRASRQAGPGQGPNSEGALRRIGAAVSRGWATGAEPQERKGRLGKRQSSLRA
eukprot:6556106-Alexandrium_andersonii.AAC.1